jgi:type II secretory pathway component HofQ
MKQTLLRRTIAFFMACCFSAVIFLSMTSPTHADDTNGDKKEQQQTEKKQKKSKKKTPVSSKYKGQRGNFIFDNADIKNVLLFFAKTYKFNLVLDPGLKGKVTLRLIDVPWDQAFDLILRQHGLAAINESGGRSIRSLKIKEKKK